MITGSRFAGVLCVFSAALFAQAPPAPASGARDLVVTVGKSVIVDSPVNIERVSVANGTVAEETEVKSFLGGIRQDLQARHTVAGTKAKRVENFRVQDLSGSA